MYLYITDQNGLFSVFFAFFLSHSHDLLPYLRPHALFCFNWYPIVSTVVSTSVSEWIAA